MGIVALLSSFQQFSPAIAGSESPDEALQRVQQLIQQGDLSGARSQLTQSLKDFPREVGFYNLLGVVEAQQGNYRAAESNFNKAIERAPRFTGACLNLGRLYQENLGKDPAALRKGIETYEKLLSYEPSNVEANYQSAVLLQLQGSFKSSLDRLSRLPDNAQQRAQALAVRCADLGALGEHSQANVTAEQLLSSPELAEADVLSILPTLQSHQQTALEVRLLEGLVKRQLASSATLRHLGLLYEQQGQLDRARETLENAAQRQPVSAALLLELAHVANKQRDHQGTLGYLAHARDLEPQNAGIHFFFGMVCVELNLSQDAYNSLKQAVSLDPNNAYYNYALGAVTLQRKDPSEAIPYFQKYRELKPDDPRGKFALGSAYFYSSNYPLARKELEAIAKNPETAAGAHYYLGRLAKQEDNLPEAGREFQQALQANPDYADAYAELGLVHLRQKEYAQAEKALRRALEIDPDNYLANLNLLNLFQRTKDNRADVQAQRFEEVKKKRSEKAEELLRTVEVVRE
jgi:tetratricopeptide (TPR) repeat protein